VTTLRHVIAAVPWGQPYSGPRTPGTEWLSRGESIGLPQVQQQVSGPMALPERADRHPDREAIVSTPQRHSQRHRAARSHMSAPVSAHGLANETVRDGRDSARRRLRPTSRRAGQRQDQRWRETPETVVVRLITHRSRVQIPPRYQARRLSRGDLEGRFRCPCDQLCDQRARKSASSVPRAPAMSLAIIISAAGRSFPVDGCV